MAEEVVVAVVLGDTVDEAVKDEAGDERREREGGEEIVVVVWLALSTLAGANLSKYSMYSMAALSVSTLLSFFMPLAALEAFCGGGTLSGAELFVADGGGVGLVAAAADDKGKYFCSWAK